MRKTATGSVASGTTLLQDDVPASSIGANESREFDVFPGHPRSIGAEGSRARPACGPGLAGPILPRVAQGGGPAPGQRGREEIVMGRWFVAWVLFAGLLSPPALSAQADSVVKLKGTTLVITGSGSADDLTLTSAFTDAADGGAAEIVVTPNKGSTVNGSTDPASFPGVLKVKASLGDGDDLLTFGDYFAPDVAVTVHGGNGEDHVVVTGATTGTFKFLGDAGNDTFEADGGHCEATKVVSGSGNLSMPCASTYFHDLTVVGSTGIDTLTWNAILVDFVLKVRLSGGSDVVSATGGTVGTVTTWNLGSGDDNFLDDMGLYGELVNMVSGSGNDIVEFRDTTIGNALNVNLGGGINELDLVAQDGQLVVGNDATIKGGSSLDTVMLRQGIGPSNIVQIGNGLVVKLASGENELDAMGDVGIGNDLRYAGGGKDDVVDLDGTDIGNDCRIDLASGTNDVFLNDCSVGNDLRITAGSGDDSVSLTGTTSVGDKTIIHLGGGNNSGP